MKKLILILKNTVLLYVPLYILTLLFFGQAFAFVQIPGFSPPTYSFAPSDYKSTSHIWSIDQNDENILFMATDIGVLIYDGSIWNELKYETSITRKVFIHNDNIYVGGDGFLGLWKKGMGMTHIFTPLYLQPSGTKNAVEEFWNIESLNDKIYFLSKQNLIIVSNNNVLTKIMAPSKFVKLFKVDDKLFVLDMDNGLYEIYDEEILKIANTEICSKLQIKGIFYDGNTRIYLSNNKGFFYIKNGEVKPWRKQNKIIKNIFCFQYSEKYLLLGTIQNGLYILNRKNGNIIHHINRSSGLINNTVLSIFFSSNNNIWLGLDYGTACVDISNPLSIYSNLNQDLGTVYTYLNDGKYWYIGSNQGLYRINPSLEDKFSLIKNTAGQVWSLKQIGGTIFVGHDKGVFLIKNDRIRLIDKKLGAWDIKPIDKKENYVISGHYSGIQIFKKIKNDYNLLFFSTEFKESCMNFEIENNNIWLTQNKEGIVLVTLKNDFSGIKHIQYFNAKNSSLPEGKIIVSKFANQIIFSSSGGTWKFDDDVKDFSSINFVKYFEKKPAKYLGIENIFWEIYDDAIIAREYKDQSKIWLVQNFSTEKTSRLHNIYKINSNLKGFLLPYHNTFARFIVGGKEDKFIDIPPKIITYFSPEDGKKKYLDSDIIEIGYRKQAEIYFAVPGYVGGKNIEYLFFNDDLNPEEKWMKKGHFLIRNLKSGQYNVELKVRLNSKIYSKKIRLVLLPPWYLSIWANSIYSLLVLLGIIIVIFKYRKGITHKTEEIQKYKTGVKKLKKKVEELEEIKLKAQIRKKTTELTMSLRRILEREKNIRELQNLIYDLQKSNTEIRNSKEFNKVVNFIKNIDTKDTDLKKFSINLQEANQVFLNKVKNKHPNLSNKELQLCILIKLNMSSKEIASLENITEKSIEIARYRLRKKLGIDKNHNILKYLNNI